MKSPNNRFRLAMQKDGNLVLYDGQTVLWKSDTFRVGESPYHLIMQSDGNLVLYDKNRKPTWKSDSSGANPTALLQNDGNFVVYDGDTAIFQSKLDAQFEEGRFEKRCVHLLNTDLNDISCKGDKKSEVVCQKGKAILFKHK